MKATTADTPILLLDEVSAELDQNRRAALLAYVLEQARGQGTAQALLTSTDPSLFTGKFLGQATVLAVREGRVTRE